MGSEAAPRWSREGGGLERVDVCCVVSSDVGSPTCGATDGRVFRQVIPTAPDSNEPPRWGLVGSGPVASGSVVALVLVDESSLVAAIEAHGVFQFDGTSWTPLGAVLGEFTATCLAVTADGMLLVGTADSGVLMLHSGGDWRRVAGGLDRVSVNCLSASQAGWVVAGSSDRGVFRWRPGQSAWSRVGDMGPSDVVALDFGERLWAAGGAGQLWSIDLEAREDSWRSELSDSHNKLTSLII